MSQSYASNSFFEKVRTGKTSVSGFSSLEPLSEVTITEVTSVPTDLVSALSTISEQTTVINALLEVVTDLVVRSNAIVSAGSSYE